MADQATGDVGEELRAARRAVALHNLRTPLAIAEGVVELLREHGDRLEDEQRDRLFDSIDSAHRRIRALAEGALFDRDLELVGEPAPGDVDPRAVVETVIIDLRDTRPVKVFSYVDDDVPDAFRGHAQTVRDALENLVTNAIKFSPEGGTVNITVTTAGNTIRFEVVDEGPGIPPDRQAGIFTGEGRGLVLVRRLVEGRGGSLGLESQPGEGSRFWVTFPMGGD